MKIRCEQNSIRLRLRRSELVQLRAEKWLSAALHFPDGQVFRWELLLDDTITDITAQMLEGRVSVKIPTGAAFQWMDTQEIGMERFIALGSGAALHILVEKDFPCKDQPGEDNADFFTGLSEEVRVKC